MSVCLASSLVGAFVGARWAAGPEGGGRIVLMSLLGALTGNVCAMSVFAAMRSHSGAFTTGVFYGMPAAGLLGLAVGLFVRKLVENHTGGPRSDASASDDIGSRN